MKKAERRLYLITVFTSDGARCVRYPVLAETEWLREFPSCPADFIDGMEGHPVTEEAKAIEALNDLISKDFDLVFPYSSLSFSCHEVSK